MRSLTQAQDGAQAKDDYEHTLTAEERKARRPASHRPTPQRGVLHASELEIVMATVGTEEEIERTRGIVDGAVEVEAKDRKVLLMQLLLSEVRFWVSVRIARSCGKNSVE